ncbi:GNAT family N-acetyltransferase [Cohnella sp. JJ-181]|uniref:GNAT family N-acetyltransferase n=1 Tax=Cohnella rhizoplanae TaxID=2974897 RepID=UPI0022FF5A14|nr:GNAT family N-acetyltransferase [Cohnella sp. JJ-181]CAI6076651.1 hypothetical protein COHCIP112018_02535 [Cohnella sp. JJ-181]
MIKALIHEQEWLEAYPVMRELRTHLDRDEYLALLHGMKDEGYKMFALYEQDRIVAVTGLIVLTNFYFGKHVFVYDLVTKASARSKGHGEVLLAYVHRYAAENGCAMVALESGISRVEAHRFYENKMGYQKLGYSLTKKL